MTETRSRASARPSAGPVNGWIKSVLYDRHYGFIRMADGREVFFHRNSLRQGLELEELRAGDPVVFAIVETAKGARAEDVGRVLPQGGAA